jgi:hypothetical protein
MTPVSEDDHEGQRPPWAGHEGAWKAITSLGSRWVLAVVTLGTVAIGALAVLTNLPAVIIGVLVLGGVIVAALARVDF